MSTATDGMREGAPGVGTFGPVSVCPVRHTFVAGVSGWGRPWSREPFLSSTTT
jgi:hypothetical protein